MRTKLTFLILVAITVPSTANADLTLIINSLTASELSFSISGNFDQDVVGSQKQWLALKPSFSTNVGINVDWLDDSIIVQNLPGPFNVITNSIEFNGSAPIASVVAGSGETWGDSFYFNAGFDITAGTTVTGTLTVQGTNLFDASTTNFQLASGFINGQNSWARLETTAIPEPVSLWSLFAIAGVALGMRRRKRQ